MSELHCGTCGSYDILSTDAGDWGWPYRCMVCQPITDEEIERGARFPAEYMRAYYIRKFGRPTANPLTRWQHFKAALGFSV